MARVVTVAAAQLGAIQKAETRQAVVKRMLDLLDQAQGQGCGLRRVPELALTTFFPRWYMTDQAEVDSWFEREMPNAATRPLFEKAARLQDRLHLRLCGADPRRPSLQHRDPGRPRRQDRRQVPQGAPARPCRVRHERAFQHLEKRYFEPGDLGFPGLAHHGRHLRHVHLQRPPLARDLSGHGPAGRRDGRARLQHAVGEFAEGRGRPREAPVPP